MCKPKSLAGIKFGKLTAMEIVATPFGKKSKHKYWKCLCDCGNYHIVKSSHLIALQVKSCGCYLIEANRERSETHGMSGHPLYGTYSSMMSRCYKKQNKRYKRYGGRGIKVFHKFKNPKYFIQWVEKNLGKKPSTKHSLDRIDNNKGYYPGNLRWANQVTQVRNRSVTKILVINGVKKSISEWCEIYNIKYSIYADRIKSGWDHEFALKTKAKKEKLFIVNNKAMSISDLATEFNISKATIKYRMKKRGMDIYQALASKKKINGYI